MPDFGAIKDSLYVYKGILSHYFMTILYKRKGNPLLLRNLALPWAFKRIDRHDNLDLPHATLYLNESLGPVLYGKITAIAF